MELAMQFPYSNLAMDTENSLRPYPAELINTPDGPYIVGTGAPLQLFTSGYFDEPAIVSTQLGTLERKLWPKSLLDLPRPLTHVDVRRKAKKFAIFFIEEFHIDNIRHVRPPTSLHDLFQGFDAVELYMYGIELCYYIMYYIGKFALEYQSKINQKIDSYTKNLVERKKKHLKQIPQAENSTEERIVHRINYKITEQMNAMEKRVFWERIYHYRKMLFDDYDEINTLKRRLDPSFSNTCPCQNDTRTRSSKFEPEGRRNLRQKQTMNESYSPSDLVTNPICRLELENPSPEKYTQGTPFITFRKFKNCKRNQNRKETVIFINEVIETVVNDQCSRIPGPKISTTLSSKRTLSSAVSKEKDSKSTYIPHIRSSDIISGKSKIPQLSCLKSQPVISGSDTSRKQSVKGNELKGIKKIIIPVTGRSKNNRKRNLSVHSQNSSPLKPGKLKKLNAPLREVEPIKKMDHVNRRYQRKPWV